MLYLATLALPALVAAQNPDTWSAYFWSGESCTSEETGSMQGTPGVDRNCYDIPELGVTQAVDFYAADSSYRFQLHTDRSCLDNEGFGYEGRSDLPVCVETNQIGGAVAYSVTRSSGSKRAVGHERRMNELTLAQRAVEERAIDSFVLTGVIGAFGFAITAAEYCPRIADPDSRNLITYPPCAISAVGAVVVSFLTAFGGSGEESKKDQASKRSLWDLDALPQLDSSFVDGYRISMSRGESHVDEAGDEWDNIIMNIVQNETGHTAQTTYSTHHATGRHIISAPHDSASVESSSNDLETRASNYYAYYAWRNENNSVFSRRSKSHDEANQLTGKLWNYARSNNKGIFCANFAVQGQQANQGIFSIQNGVFAPDFSKC